MGGARNKPTASPSYHGRRGATRGKTPTASPGTAGQPHQVTQCHHIGPTPPHTGNRLDSHQCQKGTGNQSHHSHGAHPAHHSNRHWFPTAARTLYVVLPRRCNSVLVFSAHHREDGRDGDLIGLAIPEECRGFPFTCCQDDAKRRAGCRKRGGPSSPERLQSASVCILVAQQRQHAADSLEERGACEVEKGRTGVFVTEQRRHCVYSAAVRGRSGAGTSTHKQGALWSVFPSSQPDVEGVKASFAGIIPDSAVSQSIPVENLGRRGQSASRRGVAVPPLHHAISSSLFAWRPHCRQSARKNPCSSRYPETDKYNEELRKKYPTVCNSDVVVVLPLNSATVTNSRG